MKIDYSLALLVALLATGIIWAADSWVFSRRRIIATGGQALPPPNIVEYARLLFPIIFVVLLFRSFVIEPYRVPTPSMVPAIVPGDFLIVNKFDYGLRLPILHTKILSIGEPHRGDVIVFRLPSDPSIDYVKRLVGLPGDHVVVRDNQVYINGEIQTMQDNGTYSGGYGFSGSLLANEQLGSRNHPVLFTQDRFPTDFDGVVPARHYFFMGDNRNDSQDSRFPIVGFVPEENIVGHATRIWMNWLLPGLPEWRRIGLKIS